jgi:hypothetical protein
LLGLWFRIPPGTWMYVSWYCCVLSGRSLCDGPIPCPCESYRVCVSVRVIKCSNNTLHLQCVCRKMSE